MWDGVVVMERSGGLQLDAQVLAESGSGYRGLPASVLLGAVFRGFQSFWIIHCQLYMRPGLCRMISEAQLHGYTDTNYNNEWKERLSNVALRRLYCLMFIL